MPHVIESALSALLQAVQAMLAVADRDVKALMLSQAPPSLLRPRLLQPMLDRHLEQRFRLNAYQAQCADWHQVCLTPQQIDRLTAVEEHLVYLKKCNQELIQLLASLQLTVQSEDGLLKGMEWLH